MHPHTHIIPAVAALCLSLVACTKSTDHVAPSASAVAPVATPSQADTKSLVQRIGTAGSTISTAAGEVKSLDNKLMLGDRSLLEEDDQFSGVNAVFDAPGQTTLMLSVGGMGASCPSLYMFVTLKSDGTTSKTDHFGTCSDIPQVAVANNQISVTMAEMNGRGDETWTYANDTLSKRSSVQVAGARPPAKFAFQEGEPTKIRGTLVQTADQWTLKLPEQVILVGGEYSSCNGRYVKELTLNAAPLKDAAKASGERDFDVSIVCPSAGPAIAELALPGALPVPAPAPAPKAASTLPGGTAVQIKVGGVMCANLPDMKAFIETSNPGECVVAKFPNKTLVINTQTNVPGWVFIKIDDRHVALVRTSDLIVTESAAASASQAAAPRGSYVAQGATICTDLKAMMRAAAMQRAGHLGGSPDDCLLAPGAMPVRVLGDSVMPGISVVQIGVDKAFVRSEDVRSQ